MGTVSTLGYAIYTFDGTNWNVSAPAGGLNGASDNSELAGGIDDEFVIGEDIDSTGSGAAVTDDLTYQGYMEDGAGNRFLLFQDKGNSNYYLESLDIDIPNDGWMPPSSFTTGSGTGDLQVINFSFCFAKGTGIATPAGETAVEDLQIGDMVLTDDGASVPVKWIGRQTLVHDARMNGETDPVRIAKGALGHGLPHRDLVVTADHGMVLDGLVINASALVNGTTIAFVPLAELDITAIYYHVETDAHDAILANGAAAETFVDAVSRSGFDNHAEYLELYGVERIIPEMNRPRISTARLVPAEIKARVGIVDQISEIRFDVA